MGSYGYFRGEALHSSPLHLIKLSGNFPLRHRTLHRSKAPKVMTRQGIAKEPEVVLDDHQW